MKEIIFRLEGISALIYALSQMNENSVVDGMDSACMIINRELQDCISELRNIQGEDNHVTED